MFIDKVFNYYWFSVTESLLEAGLSSVSNKEFDVGMGQNLLLWKPLWQHDIIRLAFHRLGLPLPQDPLLQLPERGQQQLTLVLGHFRCCRNSKNKWIFFYRIVDRFGFVDQTLFNQNRLLIGFSIWIIGIQLSCCSEIDSNVSKLAN